MSVVYYDKFNIVGEEKRLKDFVTLEHPYSGALLAKLSYEEVHNFEKIEYYDDGTRKILDGTIMFSADLENETEEDVARLFVAFIEDNYVIVKSVDFLILDYDEYMEVKNELPIVFKEKVGTFKIFDMLDKLIEQEKDFYQFKKPFLYGSNIREL